MRAILFAVTVLALATSTTYACDASALSTCVVSAATAIASAASGGSSVCAGINTYLACYSTSACTSTSNCNTVNALLSTYSSATGSCTLTNPCSSSTPTPTPSVTPSVTSKTTTQAVDFGTGITSATYTGVQKSNFECGYFNALGKSVAGYNAANSTAYCTQGTPTGCTTTPGTTSLVNGTNVTSAATTTCTGVTNTYITGLSSVSSTFSSSRRANKVSFVGAVLSTLLSEAQITAAGTTLAANVATLTTAINAAFANGGQTVPTFTVVANSIGAPTVVVTSSAGTVAPFFGMALAMLFAVLNY